MLNRRCHLSLAALALSVFWFPVGTRAAQPPQPIPMQATFSGVTGVGVQCRITGIGGDYVNGIDGVECTINQSSTDFILDTFTNHGPARTAAYDVTDVIPSLCPTNRPAASIPTNPVAIPVYLYVQNVLGVTVGAGWQERVAILPTGTFGTLAFSPIFNGGNCSTRVWVQALATNSWEISTNPSGYPAHDISALYQNTRTTPLPVQYQHLPFDVTISRLQ